MLHTQRGKKIVGVLNVDGPQRTREKQALWNHLVQELDSSLRWLGGGDWNFIEVLADKMGGMPRAGPTSLLNDMS